MSDAFDCAEYKINIFYSHYIKFNICTFYKIIRFKLSSIRRQVKHNCKNFSSYKLIVELQINIWQSLICAVYIYEMGNNCNQIQNQSYNYICSLYINIYMKNELYLVILIYNMCATEFFNQEINNDISNLNCQLNHFY